MSSGLEPAFAPGRPVWPLAGMGSVGFEPDDPDLVIPAGILERTARDLPEKLLLARLDSGIGAAPIEPMRPPLVAVRGWSAKWRLALAASCLLHVAVALSFLSLDSEAVLIEGAELSGVAFHGNASEDQMSEGEVAEMSDAVEVTMITMLEARPVDTVEAEMLPADEIAEPVEIVEAETAETETVQPVKTAVAHPVETANAEPVESAAAPAAAVVAGDREESVETIAQPRAPSADPVPEILATDRPEMVENDNIVQKSIETQTLDPVEAVEKAVQDTVESSTPERVEPVAATKVETGRRERAPSSSETTAETIYASRAEHVEPARVKPVETEVSETSEILEDVVSPPLPESRPEVAEPAEQEPAPHKPATRPNEMKKDKKVAAKPVSKAKTAGNGGSNQADTRRGQADGHETGQAASKSKGGKTSAAGNAAVSNYPGKVASKLRRALRYPAAAKRQRLRGQVRVSFVVSASGAVSSVRIVSSSGSSVLDKAALETVRRAAPFPDIPKAAGRSSWPFTVPLAFSR